jgi:hypothetical protein
MWNMRNIPDVAIFEGQSPVKSNFRFLTNDTGIRAYFNPSRRKRNFFKFKDKGRTAQ